MANRSGTVKRVKGQTIHEDGVLMCRSRSEVEGTIKNKEQIQKHLEEATNPNTRQHLYALVKAAEFLITEGPIVCTQDVGKYYSHHKSSCKTV